MSMYVFFATAGIATLGFRYYNRRKLQWTKKVETTKTSDRDWETLATVGEVKCIYVYALEGGHPIEVDKALCLGSGLHCKKERGEPLIGDRSFVVYTASNRICYTSSTKLATVYLTNGNALQLQIINNGKQLQIESEEITKENFIEVDYMNQKLQVYDCGDRAAQFLSKHLLDLPSGLRLGQFAVSLIRMHMNPVDEITSNAILNQHYLIESMRPEFNNFSLISDKSIDAVQGLRGCDHVTPQHFRANIVIKLGTHENELPKWQRPFLEDSFEHVQIGSASFTNVTFRSIDQTVNVDPQTGVLSANNQPFRNLQRFRQAHCLNEHLYDPISIPVLGINMTIEQTGIIKVGDVVRVKFKSYSRL